MSRIPSFGRGNNVIFCDPVSVARLTVPASRSCPSHVLGMSAFPCKPPSGQCAFGPPFLGCVTPTTLLCEGCLRCWDQRYIRSSSHAPTRQPRTDYCKLTAPREPAFLSC